VTSSALHDLRKLRSAARQPIDVAEDQSALLCGDHARLADDREHKTAAAFADQTRVAFNFSSPSPFDFFQKNRCRTLNFIKKWLSFYHLFKNIELFLFDT